MHHAKPLHVDQRLATSTHDGLLLGLVQGWVALYCSLQELTVQELHDDVGVLCQRRGELVRTPGEGRILEMPAHLIEVIGPMRGETSVVLQVPDEERCTFGTVPPVRSVVQALHGPPGLPVHGIHVPVLLRGLRQLAELGDLDSNLAEAPVHVARAVHRGEAALPEFLEVQPATLLPVGAVGIGQGEENRDGHLLLLATALPLPQRHKELRAVLQDLHLIQRELMPGALTQGRPQGPHTSVVLGEIPDAEQRIAVLPSQEELAVGVGDAARGDLQVAIFAAADRDARLGATQRQVHWLTRAPSQGKANLEHCVLLGLWLLPWNGCLKQWELLQRQLQLRPLL
mmetsp:Transcript_27020/g.80512  ORF Transcript_27020/g.80512 Transcript_27020/m.80512 type:complete len:342 (-) Transcript_27020:94-1119(-)